MNEGYPLWVVVLLAILAALGTFFGKIKSSIEVWIGGKQNIELLKINSDKEEIAKLKKRLSILEEENINLIKSKTVLSTAMLFMIDKYQKSNPEETTVIESVKQLIKENLAS